MERRDRTGSRVGLRGSGRAWIAGLAVALALIAVTPVRAQERAGDAPFVDPSSLVGRVGAKLVRGSANFLLGWAEFPKQIYLVWTHEGALAGAFRGPVDGLGMFVVRTLAGAYEVLTFPLPIPPGFPVMLEPVFVWQPDPAFPRPAQADSGMPPVEPIAPASLATR